MKAWNRTLSLLLGMGVIACQSAWPMVCVTSPVRTARLHGHVFDPFGTPIPDASVRVLLNDKIAGETRTDDRGRFDLNIASGEYSLDVRMNGLMALTQQIKIERDLRTLLFPRDVKIMLGLGGFDCPFATTSSRQFRYEIKLSNDRMKESSKNHATQK